MKPWVPFEPEPPPPQAALWKVCIALTMLILGVGIALFSFRDAGAISDEVYLAMMVFVIAASAGVIIAMDIEQQAHHAKQKRPEEIPPPFDFLLLWPPDGSDMADDGSANSAKHRPSKPPTSSRTDKP